MTAPQDHPLVIWILGWVARALTSAPRDLLNAPINVPAPGQLTGSEHFLSTALLVTPLWLLTGNATLATNLTVFLSFPAAAVVMRRLLLSLSVGARPAWVGGLLFALGPLAVPASPQLVQYLPFWLPLTVLSVRRLAQAPTFGPTVRLFLVLTGAFFSSYYMAVLAGLAALTWLLTELGTAASATRSRIAVRAGVAGMLAASLLIYFSRPWLSEAVSRVEFAREAAHTFAGWTPLIARTLSAELALLGVLATGGVLALRTSSGVSGAARGGLTLVCVGLPFLLGPRPLGEPATWAPFALLLASPLAFFRLWHRFAVLVGFGAALLASAGLELAARRRTTSWLLPASALAAVLFRGVHLSGVERVALSAEHDRIWSTLGNLSPGPLLVLPPTLDFVTNSMVAQPYHRKPLLLGYTGYLPPHRRWVDERVAALPDEDALDDLVAVTGLEWILLAPDHRWAFHGSPRRLTRMAGTVRVLGQDGWLLLRITRDSTSSWWSKSVPTSPRPGSTLFGTPLELPNRARYVGTLGLVRVPNALRAGYADRLRVTMENRGDDPWPAAAGPGPGMRLTATWHPDSSAGAGFDSTILLRRDVAPGERLEQWVPLVVPAIPGTWRLELRLTTESGTVPGIAPVSTNVEVLR